MINNISNGESGVSVRTKLNEVIDQVNIPITAINLPKTRDIYLVGNSTDQTALGGTANNVYITAQAAYDAANTLQTTLGGQNLVAIRVLETVTTANNSTLIATAVGGITLSANWNNKIVLIGIDPKISMIDSITAPGYIIDAKIANVRIGTNAATTAISTAAVTGGNQILSISNVVVGLITSESTNSTGTAGNITIRQYISSLFADNTLESVIGNVRTRSGAGAGQAGNMIITANCTITGNIELTTTNPFNLAPITVQIGSPSTKVSCNGTVVCSDLLSSSASQLSFINFTALGKTTIIITGSGSSIKFQNCVLEEVELYENNVSPSTLNVEMVNVLTTGSKVFANNALSGNRVKIAARNCQFYTMTNVGSDSTFMNCSFYRPNTTGTMVTLNASSTGVEFYNSTIVGGTTSIDCGSAVNVKFTTGMSSIKAAKGSNVTFT